MVGTYGLVQMVLRIPLGVLSDRWGRRLPFLYAGHFFNFVGCLGLALAPTATYLAVFRGVLGISAATWVAFTVLYASYFPADETPKAMGIMSAINGVSLIVVNLAGGQIAESWGMVATFYAGAGLAVIGLISTVPIKEKRVTRTPPTVRQIWRVMTHPALLIAASVTALNHYAFWATTFSFIPVYADDLGASKFTLGIIGVVSLVPYTLASLVNHRFAQRLGDNWAVFAGMMIMAATTFVVPLIHDVPLLAASQGINGIGRGIVLSFAHGAQHSRDFKRRPRHGNGSLPGRLRHRHVSRPHDGRGRCRPPRAWGRIHTFRMCLGLCGARRACAHQEKTGAGGGIARSLWTPLRNTRAWRTGRAVSAYALRCSIHGKK